MFIYKYHGGPNDGETFTTVTKISWSLFYVPKPNTKIEKLAYEVHGFNLIFQEGQDYARK
mgnify:CR=1 FL=1